MRGARALILDADGVLLYAGRPIDGAVAALERIEDAGVPYRVVTNYSLAHRTTLAAGVSRQFGRPVQPGSIITAASAAAAHTLRRYPGRPLLVLASDDALREWDGQAVVDPEAAEAATTAGEPVAAVVIGDAGDALSFRNLDIAFRAIRAGAAFVAMHRNPWWVTPRGPTLDAGALVKGLEWAVGNSATVTGKPSPVVFGSAVRDLAAELRVAGRTPLRRRDIVMVGDDLESDIAGAHRAGLRAVLTLTGKTSHEALEPGPSTGGVRGRAVPDGVARDLGAAIEALLGPR